MQQNTDLTTLLFQLFNKVNANEHTHGQKPLTFSVDNTAYTVSLAECHVLDYIARHDKTNAISIAAASGITRGGISKITARLEQKGLVTVTAAPDNKKMLSYSLTQTGQAICSQHQQTHQQTFFALEKILQQYTAEEIACIKRFIQQISEII